jgi:hypothetical protein
VRQRVGMPKAPTDPIRALIAYDGSDAAAEAIRAAAHLVPGAHARVVYVRGEPDALEHVALARIAVPDDVLVASAREYERVAKQHASELAERGRQIAERAGLDATAATPSRGSYGPRAATASRCAPSRPLGAHYAAQPRTPRPT